MLCYGFGNTLDYDHNPFGCQIWIFSILEVLDMSLQFNCEPRLILVLDPYFCRNQCYLCI